MFRLFRRSGPPAPIAPEPTATPTAATPAADAPAADAPASPARERATEPSPGPSSPPRAAEAPTERGPRRPSVTARTVPAEGSPPPSAAAAARETTGSGDRTDAPSPRSTLTRAEPAQASAAPAPRGATRREELLEDDASETAPVPLNPSAPAFSTPLLLLRSAHLRQGVLIALALGIAAAVTGRPLREVALVMITVLVGQTVLGWHNDLVDAERDHRHDTPGKPVAQGLLEVGTLWYAIGVGALVLVPLAVLNGVTAALWYLFSMAAGLLGNLALRQTVFSWVPWALAWACYVPFLSHGGWGGQATGSTPEPVLLLLGAGIGVCVHVLVALPGLLADHKDGSRSLPLRLGLWWGAPRLLWVTGGTLSCLVFMLVWVARQFTQSG